MDALSGIVVLSLFISAVGIYSILRYYRRAKQSTNWSRFPGSLMRCEIVERLEDAGHTHVYDLDVRYSYEVSGNTYESSEIMFYIGKWSSQRSYYVDIRDTILKQEPLQVYVNPDDSKQSVLIPGVSHASVGMLWAAGFMMLFCPFCWFQCHVFLLLLAISVEVKRVTMGWRSAVPIAVCGAERVSNRSAQPDP
jgi:hypothetical protein